MKPRLSINKELNLCKNLKNEFQKKSGLKKDYYEMWYEMLKI